MAATRKNTRKAQETKATKAENSQVSALIHEAFAYMEQGDTFKLKANVKATMAVAWAVVEEKVSYETVYNAAGYGASKEQNKEAFDVVLTRIGEFDLSDKANRPTSSHKQLMKSACQATSNIMEKWSSGEPIPCMVSEKTGNLIVPGHALYSDLEGPFNNPDKACLNAIPVTGGSKEAFSDLIRRANSKFKKTEDPAPQEHEQKVKDAAVSVVSQALTQKLEKARHEGRPIKEAERESLDGVFASIGEDMGWIKEGTPGAVYAVQRMVNNWTQYADAENGAEIMEALAALYDELDGLFGPQGELKAAQAAE